MSAPEKKQISKCSGCGAEIYWVKTTAGADMPLDTKRHTILIPESWTQGAKGETADAKWITVSGFQSHFSTCPRREQFKKSKTEEQ